MENLRIKNMKKGFTLAETLISLSIIGVIAALTIPMLIPLMPDKSRTMYKKAVYSVQNSISMALNDSSSIAASSSTGWATTGVTSTTLCTDIAKGLNTMGTVSCTAAGSDAAPNFITVDGAAWWGLGGVTLSVGSPTVDAYVDINTSHQGKNVVGDDIFRVRIKYNGKVSVDPSWSKEVDYLGSADFK